MNHRHLSTLIPWVTLVAVGSLQVGCQHRFKDPKDPRAKIQDMDEVIKKYHRLATKKIQKANITKLPEIGWFMFGSIDAVADFAADPKARELWEKRENQAYEVSWGTLNTTANFYSRCANLPTKNGLAHLKGQWENDYQRFQSSATPEKMEAAKEVSILLWEAQEKIIAIHKR